MDTDLHAAAEDTLKPLLASLCFPRFGRLDEVVAPILFLAGPEASYITGTTIDADGGYNARVPISQERVMKIGMIGTGSVSLPVARAELVLLGVRWRSVEASLSGLRE